MHSTATPLEPLEDEDQASFICKIHKKTLYNERKAGRLGFVQIGSRILYEPAELRRWIAAHRVQASK